MAQNKNVDNVSNFFLTYPILLIQSSNSSKNLGSCFINQKTLVPFYSLYFACYLKKRGLEYFLNERRNLGVNYYALL